MEVDSGKMAMEDVEDSITDLNRQDMYRLVARQLFDDGHVELAKSVSKATGVSLDPLALKSELLQTLRQNTVSPLNPFANNSANSSFLNGMPVCMEPEEFSCKFVYTAKAPCRVAAFSPDGALCAVASDDHQVKIMDVVKMHESISIKNERSNEEYLNARPGVRVYFDHQMPVNDLAFHPTRPIFFSGSEDRSIKIFDYSRENAKRAIRQINESGDVRSISLHPSGDFLAVATDSPVLRLYDLNTFEAYTASERSHHHTMPITQVRYSDDSLMFATCSQDGTVKIWDAVNFVCVRTLEGVHGGNMVSSVCFSHDCSLLLTSGLDSTARVWDISSGREVISFAETHQLRKLLPAVFLFGDRLVITPNESNNNVICYDVVTGERLMEFEGHSKITRWVSASPIEPAFISCSEDGRSRFWASRY